MNFKLPCECGQVVVVTERSAGALVGCPCGRSVRVPALHELRLSVGLPPYPLSPEMEIEHMLTTNDFPDRGPCSRCGRETTSVVQVLTRFGERVEGPSAGDRIAGLLLGLLAGIFVFWRRDGPRQFDREYWLPLLLCPTCRPRVRRARHIKECLRDVEVYDRLLEKHPYAEVMLS
jgi:hypothetical protein